ncbi:MAG: RsfS/YbeB/iojap family protein, partial [Lactococcus lactis]
AEAAELAGAKAAGHIEGDAKTGWVLIDLGDIVVSVFGHDERGHFNLEKLWSDAPMVDISGFMAE